jgi:multiple sugar transport system ATP-binding protein
MIYVTHDQVEAMTMADKIVVLNAGRIEQVGAPLDLYNNPANRFVAGFIGSPKMNFLQARVERVGEAETTINVCGNSVRLPRRLKADAGQTVTFGIRPEHLSVLENSGITLATVNVDLVENLGGATMLYATTPDGQQLTIALDGQQKVERGTNVKASFDPARCHVFDASGATI